VSPVYALLVADRETSMYGTVFREKVTQRVGRCDAEVVNFKALIDVVHAMRNVCVNGVNVLTGYRSAGVGSSCDDCVASSARAGPTVV
jgi:hypothetical protein